MIRNVPERPGPVTQQGRKRPAGSPAAWISLSFFDDRSVRYGYGYGIVVDGCRHQPVGRHPAINKEGLAAARTDAGDARFPDGDAVVAPRFRAVDILEEAVRNVVGKQGD